MIDKERAAEYQNFLINCPIRRACLFILPAISSPKFKSSGLGLTRTGLNTDIGSLADVDVPMMFLTLDLSPGVLFIGWFFSSFLLFWHFLDVENNRKLLKLTVNFFWSILVWRHCFPILYMISAKQIHLFCHVIHILSNVICHEHYTTCHVKSKVKRQLHVYLCIIVVC